jgi:hypothetical protein
MRVILMWQTMRGPLMSGGRVSPPTPLLVEGLPPLAPTPPRIRGLFT